MVESYLGQSNRIQTNVRNNECIYYLLSYALRSFMLDTFNTLFHFNFIAENLISHI